MSPQRPFRAGGSPRRGPTPSPAGPGKGATAARIRIPPAPAMGRAIYARSHSTSCTPVARRPDCRAMRCLLSRAEQRATRQVKQGFHVDACRCTPNTQIVLSPAHRTEYSTAPSGARRPGHVLSSRTGWSFTPATAAANPGEQRPCGSPALSAWFACICMHLRETLACFAACRTLLGPCGQHRCRDGPWTPRTGQNPMYQWRFPHRRRPPSRPACNETMVRLVRATSATRPRHVRDRSA